MLSPIRRLTRENGFTLLELLIAVAVFSVGLIGMAGLMGRSIQWNHSAFSRSQAVFLANNLSERMRANTLGVATGAYADIAINAPGIGPSPGPACDALASSCTPAQIAIRDATDWQIMVARLLPFGQGTAQCATTVIVIPNGGATPPSDNLCTITVSWSDNADGNPAGLSQQQIQIQVQP